MRFVIEEFSFRDENGEVLDFVNWPGDDYVTLKLPKSQQDMEFTIYEKDIDFMFEKIKEVIKQGKDEK